MTSLPEFLEGLQDGNSPGAVIENLLRFTQKDDSFSVWPCSSHDLCP
jgi:hypothetical protein